MDNLNRNHMEFIKSILYFLDGKKLHIANIIGLVSSFLMSRGFIEPDTLALIIQILSILTSGAQIATVQLGVTRKY